MPLLDLVIPTRINARWQYSGIDSIERCADKTHFKNYPYPVEYVYNSRGFRDAEWSESVDELRNAIWCVGDSFTVGLGSPLEHTWPYLLQQQTGRRCINVSLDGASNDWIARKTQRLIEEINPTDIVIMWSYTNRREKNDNSLSDEDRRTQGSVFCNGLENAVNFKSCLGSLSHSNITHTAIPNAYNSQNFIINYLNTLYNNVADTSWPQEVIADRTTLENLPLHILNELKFKFKIYNEISECIDEIEVLDYCDRVYKIKQVTQLDRARDYFHFDKLTSQWFIEQICQ
jgi:hypothetical protein